MNKSEAKKNISDIFKLFEVGFSTIAIIVYNKLFEKLVMNQKISDFISFDSDQKNDLILQFLFYNFYNKAYMYITYVYYKMHLVGWRRE